MRRQLIDLWKRLTTTKDSDARAHLLASFSLALGMVVLPIYFIRLGAGVTRMIELPVALFALISLYTIFRLSHGGYYRVGAMIWVAVGTIVTFAMSLDVEDSQQLQRLDYLAATIVFSGLFLSLRVTILITIVQVVGIWVMAVATPQMTLVEAIEGPITFNVVIGIITILLFDQLRRYEVIAREAQAKSERYFRSLMDSLPQSVYSKDLAGRMTFANRVCLANENRKLEDILGQTDYDMHPPELAEKYRADDRWVIENRRSIEVVETHHPTDGPLTYVHVIKSPIMDDEGTVKGVMGIFWDVTETYQMQQALAKSEHLMRTLIDSLPQNIFSKDLEGRFIYANRNYCLQIGRAREEIIGKTDYDIHPLELAEKYRADDRQVIEQQQIFDVVEVHQALGGDPTFVHVIKAPIYDDKGKPNGVLGIFWDVTEQQKMEQALRESEARYRTVVSAIAEGILLRDAEEVIETCNASAAQILGVTMEQIVGQRKLDKYVRILQADGSAFPFEIQPAYIALQTGQPQSNVVMGVIRADESLVWLSVNAQPLIKQGETRPYAVVVSFRDITDLKRAEQQAMEVALERERRRIHTQFIRDASHEFRTPLSIIQTNLALLRLVNDPSEQDTIIKQADRQCSHILRLVEDLVTLSQLDGELTLELSECDVNQVIAEVVLHFRHRFKDCKLELELSETLPRVQMDYRWLREGLEPLFHNALRYTPPDGTITLRTYADGTTVVFEIQDTGIGIEPQHLPRIFERFYRGDAAHSTAGFGLGLAIAKLAMERMGGQINVESTVGEGSVFRVSLPIRQMALADKLADGAVYL